MTWQITQKAPHGSGTMHSESWYVDLQPRRPASKSYAIRYVGCGVHWWVYYYFSYLCRPKKQLSVTDGPLVSNSMLLAGPVGDAHA